MLQSRLIIDEHFLDDLFKDVEKAKEYLRKLQKIHTSSEGYKWDNNIILDKSFISAIGTNKEIRRMGLLLGAMHPISFWDEEGLHTSVIKQAITMASKPPFKVYVLTSSNNCDKYNKNKHYNNYEYLKEAIIIEHGQNALDIINRLYSECM